MSRTTIKGRTTYGVPSIVTSGLILYLDAGNKKSYSGSGTAWYDISGNSYVSTIFNPSYSSQYGGGIVGAGNSQATLPTININTDFTYQWVTTKTSNTNPYLVGGLFTNAANFYFGQSSIYCVKNGTGTVIDFGASTATSLSVPYFITIKFIKSTNTFYSYINGIFISSVVYNPTFKTDSQLLLRPSSSTGLTGTLNIFMCYNRSLTDSEVLQNYNALKGRFGL